MQSILAAIALVLLVIPCVHADEHLHAEETHAFSAPACEQCHGCAEEEPCAKPEQIAQTSLTSPVELPVRLVQQIAVYEHTVPVPLPAPRPPGGLQLLQTIQLLI